ncbi:hypothetical protein DH2020_017802 [Rehmannia glutinosa]|uniref:Protein kinase domain-containing protein n=1 Tax=Rehmannia glutinosa TaxID=99300 RepID=A0ABR0WL82_REHGL
MEGLIPFVYRAILQYKNGGQGNNNIIETIWLNESPSASYMRLPGDSGRFSASEIQLFRPDCGFSAGSPPHSAAVSVVVRGSNSSTGSRPNPSLSYWTPCTTMAGMHCGPCGKTPVPYPLSTGPNCGDQAYKIKCNPATSTLYFVSKVGVPYVITAVDSKDQRMVIRPLLYYQTPASQRIIAAKDFRLTTRLRSTSPAAIRYCSAACRKPTLCCSFRTGGSQNAYIIRVHPNGCMAYQSYVNLDPGLPFAKWSPPGLELMWASPPEPLCKTTLDCRELPFSKCLPDPRNAGQKRCLCKKGRYWDPASGYCQTTTGVILLLALTGFLVYRQRQYVINSARKTLIKEREDILNANTSGKSAKIFSGKEIKKATTDFSKENLLGFGGFGEVFKGTLEDGAEIAVKRPKAGNAKGNAQVLNEVQILCQVNHRSLVRLLGCCVELEDPLLIRSSQAVPAQLAPPLIIAHQTADGLAYLHSSAEPPIYHRDVKSSNILLDEKLDAKERCLQFRVVLLELLTSEKAIDFNREEENVNLVVYMKRVFDGGKLMAVIDPVLRDGATEVELETMKAVGDLAAACLDDRRQNRPSMKEVADEIECVISIITGDDSKT